LNVYDAAATPIVAAFAKQPLVASFSEIKPAIAMEMNPGKAVSSSLTLPIDGPDAAAIADQDWASVRGAASLVAHHAYLRGQAQDDRAVAQDDRVVAQDDRVMARDDMDTPSP
ncbi:MAG: hypothetical protein JO225_01780, partial [Candidatus Eremiobacteraeota bacterium]|nr:hypothetical protein [Candidatus Eremiobacteraeota bacterium]